MGEVHGPGLIVVRQVAKFPPVRGDLDDREGRIGEAGDPYWAPLFGRGGGGQRQKRECDDEKKSKAAPHIVTISSPAAIDNVQKPIQAGGYARAISTRLLWKAGPPPRSVTRSLVRTFTPRPPG